MPGQAKNILDHFYSFLVSGKSLAKKNMLAIGTSGSPVDSDVWEGVRIILKKTAYMALVNARINMLYNYFKLKYITNTL